MKNQRAKLEARLGLSNVPGMDSKSLGVTDDDVINAPPRKKLKREHSTKSNNGAQVDLNEQWRLMFDEPPTYSDSSDSWSLKWFYTRVRLGLGSKVKHV